MSARLTALAVVLLFGTAAFAQEKNPLPEPFVKQFSLEIATGLPPIHTIANANNVRYDRSFADQGKEPDMDGYWMPSMSISAVWKTARRWEMVLTGGVSWCHHKMTRYGTFGTDPHGKPRYNLKDPHFDGWRDSALAGALFFQARCFWNPTQKVKLYSAFGGGLITNGSGFYMADDAHVAPVPSITPIAVRFGTGHLKFFIENTFSPAATLLDVGLGWTF